MKNFCIIPAKGTSTRLAKKNLLKLGEHTLLAYSIRKAIKSNIFDAICVSTEDKEIAGVARKYGLEVPFLRPASLSRDPATIMDVVMHALEYYADRNMEFDNVTVLLPTSPFVEVDHILDAHNQYFTKKAEALLGVTECEFPPFNAWIVKGDCMEPCFSDSPYKFTQSTSCPVTYRSNGAILILNVGMLKKFGHYKNLNMTPYIMDAISSIDIDNELEYTFAKFVFSHNSGNMEKELFSDKKSNI